MACIILQKQIDHIRSKKEKICINRTSMRMIQDREGWLNSFESITNEGIDSSSSLNSMLTSSSKNSWDADTCDINSYLLEIAARIQSHSISINGPYVLQW